MPRTAVLSLAALVAVTLAGCDMATTRATMEALTLEDMASSVTRTSEEAFAELPFTRGTVAVVWTERGDLQSDRLFPCQASAAVCLNSPHGRASTVQRTDHHYILDFGDGRVFFLRPGGSGTLRTARGDVPLAWNADVNGVPIWPQAIWPQTPWISQVEPGPNP